MKRKINKKKAKSKFDSARNKAKLEKEFITSGYTNKEEYIKAVETLYNKGLTMRQATNRVKLNKNHRLTDNQKLRKFLVQDDVRQQIRLNVDPKILNKTYDPIKAAANVIKETVKMEKRSMESAIERFKMSKAFNSNYTDFDRYRMNASRLLKKMAGINSKWENINFKDGVYYLPDGTKFKFERKPGESPVHLYLWDGNSWIDKGVAYEFGVFSI